MARLEPQRRDRDQLWQQRLELAADAAERAARHDRLSEPEPRLVAHRHLQAEDERLVPELPQPLSAAERETTAPLAPDGPALEQAPTTTLAKRNAIVRQIVHRGMVAAEGTSEHLRIPIAWVGGGTTGGSITRPISRIEHVRASPRLGEPSRALVQAGDRTSQITAGLAHEGVRSPKPAKPFSRQSVGECRRRLEAHHPRSRHRPPLRQHAWGWSDVERTLGVAQTRRCLAGGRAAGGMPAGIPRASGG